MPFPYIEVRGTPYQMGYDHGRQAAAQIAAFLGYLVEGTGRSRATVLEAAAAFLPLFERYCPWVLEEVRGLAEGAGLRLEEALLLQIRGEVLPHLATEGCTTFAVSGARTADGGILIGQNSDVSPEMEQFFLVIQLIPEEGPRLLMWTLAGQLGYHGVSEYGVAHFANSLGGGPLGKGAPGAPVGLPHYPIKRRMYECRTRAEILALWEALPVCSNGNYVLSSADPAVFDVEATPEGIAVLEAGEAGYVAHANHFLSPRFRTSETNAAALPDSFQRQARIDALLRQERDPLTVERLKAILSDHQDAPQSICRHEMPGSGKMSTVAGLIAEPQAGRLHVSRGHPCRGDWTCYTLGEDIVI